MQHKNFSHISKNVFHMSKKKKKKIFIIRCCEDNYNRNSKPVKGIRNVSKTTISIQA